MKKGIIFDMDGTLWDSAENVAKSWSLVVEKHYPHLAPITCEMMQGVMGKTMDQIALALFPGLEDNARNELLEECCVVENEYLSIHGGVLYEGLKETLEILKDKYNLYIVSNCQSGYIEAFLKYYNFAQYFDDIECFGNNGLKKGDNIKNVVVRNNLDKAVYVGDIQGDFDAAMEAGIDFIHAAYGFGDINQQVPKINSLEELPKFVKYVLG